MNGTYRRYVNKEPIDHNILVKWELLLALKKMKDELFNFSFYLQALFSIFYQLFPKKSKFMNDLLRTQQLFQKDLIKQFEKFIIKNGKYSSEMYKNKDFFKETSEYIYFYDSNGDVYLNADKNYYKNLSI